MKILYTLFIALFSLQASAQIYVKMPWQKKHERFPALALVHEKTPPPALICNTSFTTFKTDLGRSRYSIDAEEAMCMRNLRHSMRYGQAAMRIQFDSLASFYFRQNRFSEAKWYVLRSNAISRQQKNYEGIIGSLVVLADVKSNLGDFKQADEDLLEAKNIAALHSLTPNLLLIEQHTKQIKLNKDGGIKVENHYAELL
ncbi:hypothetical protein [uncultured Mucilaginibacter sp.]|uniref:hypothetical protein n=1 Tax=uncultured Mucilaginibacter sp. TaxID=797541 RepID=UPI0026343CD8|nr:hypothetical protein [uncultured Mucilaginibacter sp.]